MTNKEKINKKDDQKLTDFLINVNSDRCHICAKKDKCQILHRDVVVDECYKGIEEWLKQETELTADEMFEKLGYKKKYSSDYDCIFERKDGEMLDKIIISMNHSHCYYYNKHRIINNKYPVYIVTISEAEDEAIHKKIEELKKKW